MGALAVALPLLNNALALFGAFKGSAAQAKANSAIQEALGLINALTPLFQSFGNGTEVTLDQLKAALAGQHTALAALDDEIAKQGG